MSNSRFVMIPLLTPSTLEGLRQCLPMVDCPCCGGTGVHLTRRAYELLGMEGELVTARLCDICQNGKVPGFSAN
jgi:hypothetical protein